MNRNTKTARNYIKDFFNDRKNRIALIGIPFILMIIGFMVYSNVKLKPETIDKDTLCPEKRTVNHHTVVLVDKSDMWDSDDAVSVSNLLASLYSDIPTQGRLTLLSIIGDDGVYNNDEKRPESTVIKTLFDMCNPGSEKECNELYESCGRIRKQYMESFGGPLKELTTMLMKPGMSSYSPLFETLIKIIDDNENKKLEIHLISDLMENGRRFRFYDVIPLADELIKEYPLPKRATKLAIHMHVIERRKHSRDLINAVQSVWREYFNKQGAVIEFERLLIAD